MIRARNIVGYHIVDQKGLVLSRYRLYVCAALLYIVLLPTYNYGRTKHTLLHCVIVYQAERE